MVFYGKPLDDERLQLSLVESAYLLEQGLIEIKDGTTGNIPDLTEFSETASSIDPDFERKYSTYVDLRSRGFVPKTGFKFGTHFRVYNEVKSLNKPSSFGLSGTCNFQKTMNSSFLSCQGQ